jgi:hypothetical protein
MREATVAELRRLADGLERGEIEPVQVDYDSETRMIWSERRMTSVPRLTGIEKFTLRFKKI